MKQSCDQPHTPDEPSTRAALDDDFFYPMYPTESYDLNNSGPATAAAHGQSSPKFSATREADCGYPPLSWDSGLFDPELSLPLNSPGTAPGEGPGLESPGPWDSGVQPYPDLMSGSMATTDPTSQHIPVEDLSWTYYTPSHDKVAMANSMPQYAPVEEPPGGRSDSVKWPPPQVPPKGQISPSTSQSSYYTSPASHGGAHPSRNDSCSSIPALKISALGNTRPDARLRPVPGQALLSSPDEARPSPAGIVASIGPYTSRGSSASAQNHSSSATTTTTEYSEGIVSPAMTPSPRNRTATFADQPSRHLLAHHEPDQQKHAKTNTEPKALAPKQTVTQKKQQDAEGQAQQQQQQQPSSPGRRNRGTANKSRAKSRQAAADLESTERVLRSENRELSAAARGLRDEVLKLKNELLAHGKCDDPLIQQYLTSQARRVGYGAAQQAQQAEQRLHQHRQGRGHVQS